MEDRGSHSRKRKQVSRQQHTSPISAVKKKRRVDNQTDEEERRGRSRDKKKSKIEEQRHSYDEVYRESSSQSRKKRASPDSSDEHGYIVEEVIEYHVDSDSELELLHGNQEVVNRKNQRSSRLNKDEYDYYNQERSHQQGRKPKTQQPTRTVAESGRNQKKAKQVDSSPPLQQSSSGKKNKSQRKLMTKAGSDKRAKQQRQDEIMENERGRIKQKKKSEIDQHDDWRDDEVDEFEEIVEYECERITPESPAYHRGREPSRRSSSSRNRKSNPSLQSSKQPERIQESNQRGRKIKYENDDYKMANQRSSSSVSRGDHSDFQRSGSCQENRRKFYPQQPLPSQQDEYIRSRQQQQQKQRRQQQMSSSGGGRRLPSLMSQQQRHDKERRMMSSGENERKRRMMNYNNDPPVQQQRRRNSFATPPPPPMPKQQRRRRDEQRQADRGWLDEQDARRNLEMNRRMMNQKQQRWKEEVRPSARSGGAKLSMMRPNSGYQDDRAGVKRMRGRDSSGGDVFSRDSVGMEEEDGFGSYREVRQAISGGRRNKNMGLEVTIQRDNPSQSSRRSNIDERDSRTVSSYNQRSRQEKMLTPKYHQQEKLARMKDRAQQRRGAISPPPSIMSQQRRRSSTNRSSMGGGGYGGGELRSKMSSTRLQLPPDYNRRAAPQISVRMNDIKKRSSNILPSSQTVKMRRPMLKARSLHESEVKRNNSNGRTSARDHVTNVKRQQPPVSRSRDPSFSSSSRHQSLSSKQRHANTSSSKQTSAPTTTTIANKPSLSSSKLKSENNSRVNSRRSSPNRSTAADNKTTTSSSRTSITQRKSTASSSTSRSSNREGSKSRKQATLTSTSSKRPKQSSSNVDKKPSTSSTSSNKKADKSTVDVLEVDWTSASGKNDKEKRNDATTTETAESEQETGDKTSGGNSETSGKTVLKRFQPDEILRQCGVSSRLLPTELVERVRDVCDRQLIERSQVLVDDELGSINRINRKLVEDMINPLGELKEKSVWEDVRKTCYSDEELRCLLSAVDRDDVDFTLNRFSPYEPPSIVNPQLFAYTVKRFHPQIQFF